MLHYEGVWNERQCKLNKGEVVVETSQKHYKQYTAHKKNAYSYIQYMAHKKMLVIGLAQIFVSTFRYNFRALVQ